MDLPTLLAGRRPLESAEKGLGPAVGTASLNLWVLPKQAPISCGQGVLRTPHHQPTTTDRTNQRTNIPPANERTNRPPSRTDRPTTYRHRRLVSAWRRARLLRHLGSGRSDGHEERPASASTTSPSCWHFAARLSRASWASQAPG